MFGYLASKWMHELATKGEAAKAAIPPSHSIDTGVDLIDKSNVAGFKVKLAELKRS
jgi:ribose transport system substrate-binding protein